MSDLILREWNSKAIRQRNDGYFSATDMCHSCNKLFGNWNQLNSTKEYLEALQNKHYCDSNNGQFIESNVGGTPETTGTWVHRKVALRLLINHRRNFLMDTRYNLIAKKVLNFDACDFVLNSEISEFSEIVPGFLDIIAENSCFSTEHIKFMLETKCFLRKDLTSILNGIIRKNAI